MGLSNSIRELLLENIKRNNYVNDLKPVSKQIEFSTVEELHHKTIEESKKIKVKKSKDKNKEFKIDKIESSQKEEEEEKETADMIETFQKKNEDLLHSADDISDDEDNDLIEDDGSTDMVISQDVEDDDEEVEEVEEVEVEKPVEKSDEKHVEKSDEKPVEKPDENKSVTKDTTKSSSKKEDSSKSTSINEFFESLNVKINSANKDKPEVKSTHKTSNDLSGGANIKKIKLTEKYDFF